MEYSKMIPVVKVRFVGFVEIRGGYLQIFESDLEMYAKIIHRGAQRIPNALCSTNRFNEQKL